jgi:RNA polymerase sigma factor (sigma-70 family)
MSVTFLTASEEHDLTVQAQAGDVLARDKVIAGIMPLIHRFALRIAHDYPPVDTEDLEQEALEELMHKFGRYDPERGRRFITYFQTPIIRAMLKIAKQNGVLKSPCRSKSKNPILEAIRVKHSGQLRSLNVRAEDFDCDEIDNLPDTHEDTPENHADRIALSAAVRECIERVPMRWRQLMRWRYIDDLTFEEIGVEVHLTRERIRQILGEAMRWVKQILLIDPVVKEYVRDQGCVTVVDLVKESPRPSRRVEPRPRRVYPPKHKKERNSNSLTVIDLR